MVTAKRTVSVLSVALLVTMLAIFASAGCARDTGGEEPSATETQNGESDAAAGDAGEDSGDASSDAASQSDMEYDALRIAQAWFVAQTDFTKDQFEWTVESFVEADDGSYYARISAAPNDVSLETEQIYVEKPVDLELWYPIDMGTGIDPSTDERFPEEVRDQL